MEAEFKFEVTDELLVRCARKVALRHRWYLLPVYPVTGLFLCLLIAKGEYNWLGGAGVAVLALGLLIRVRSYMRVKRASLAYWRRVEHRWVVCRVTDEAFEMDAAHATAAHPWKMFERLRQFRDVWLLYLSGRGYSPIPTDVMSEGVRDFITRKVRENGGKVR